MAQPSVNDVLTWDGTKGVYAPNPALSLELTDTYIFVGNALDVATGVPLTLNDEPGPFALANTGVLTMPDASVLGRGLLNASSWTTVGFLHNDGSGGLEWQVVSTSQTLAATLAIGNNVGGLAITATDGSASLNLTTGTAIVYANSGSAGAPRFTLDQSLGLARMSSTYGVVDFDATAMNLTAINLINFSAPQYNITNIATDSYLYVDSGGYIVAGATPIVTVPGLSTVLGVSGVTGDQAIESANNKSQLFVYDAGSSLSYIDGAETTSFAVNSGNVSMSYSNSSTFESGSIAMTIGGAEITHNVSVAIGYDDGTNQAYSSYVVGQSRLLFTDGSAGGAVNITSSFNNIDHTAQVNLDAPILQFTTSAFQISYLTNDRVVCMGFGGQLESSVVTITELSYVSGVTSPLQAQIDAIVSGLSWKQAVRVRTTVNITLSGAQIIDGVSVIAGDRVLVMNQTLPTENGIYVCAAGVWSRATDADTGADLLQATVATQEGALYADQQYVCTTDAPIVIGVSNIVFILVGGTTYVGTTNRITVTGNVIDIAATYLGQTSITTLGTITTGVWNGTALTNTYMPIVSVAKGGTALSTVAAGSILGYNTLDTATAITSTSGLKTLQNNAGTISWITTTGTGDNVYSTSPTFVTQIFTPLIVGGTTAGSKIDYKSTSGVGTTTAVAHEFWGGNNGGTNLAGIYNDGQFLIGTTTRNPTSGGMLRVSDPAGGASTNVDIGSSSVSNAAIWLGQTTPSGTNYAILGPSTTAVLVNGAASLSLRVANVNKIVLTPSTIAFTPSSITSGSGVPFTFTAPASTGQTASTEVSGFAYSLTTNRQWLTGALTTQREVLISAPTYRFAGASVISDAATLAISGAPIASTNATITRSYALWSQGLTRLDAGVFNDGGGLKHARVTTGAIGAGSTVLVTITWTTAFADANYTVNASVLEATGSALSLSIVHIESQTASAVTVRVLNNAAGSLTGTVHVIAIHD